MRQHGAVGKGKSKIKPAGPGDARTITGTPPGFRHTPDDRDCARRFTVDGADPATARATLEDRMFRLNWRMQSPNLQWNPVPDPKDGRDYIKPATPEYNPFIPSGYTYLLQFIAHDMVLTPMPFWAVGDLETETSNERADRLRLDTLYGGGPFGIPGIYAPDTDKDLSRTRLQLGRSAQVGTGAQALCPFRDVARLKLHDTLDDLPGRTEPLIADPRNDDHAIISQMTVLFHLLHNVFVSLQPAPPDSGVMPDFIRQTGARFFRAREATTLLYRHIIREDVMRRILHPKIYALYNRPGVEFLDDRTGQPGTALPLEFSHGAFRFAHAMVRDTYRINDHTFPDGEPLSRALQLVSNRNPSLPALKTRWIVQWANFFNIPDKTDPAKINLSRRIGPHVPLMVRNEPFSRVNGTQGTGVMYRDLLSAGLSGLWSVDTLIDAIGRSRAHREIMADSPLLSSRMARADAIRVWLEGNEMPWQGMPADERERTLRALSEEPTLPFFTLFEAFSEPAAGTHLGILGSTIIAETVFGELERNKLTAEQVPGDLHTRLESISDSFKGAHFKTMTTMSDVVSFVWSTLQERADRSLTVPSLI